MHHNMRADLPGDRIASALDIIEDNGLVEGAHHKQWVVDQVLRALTGDAYDSFVATCIKGEWDEGVAP